MKRPIKKTPPKRKPAVRKPPDGRKSVAKALNTKRKTRVQRVVTKKRAQPKKPGGGFKTHAMRVTTSSKKHKWRTDPRLIALIEKFAKGKIGLDPCAAKDVKHQFAKVNYTKHNGLDGTIESWRGRGVTYANPEYQRGVLNRFVNKAIEQFCPLEATGVTLDDFSKDHLFLLVPARPDTRWFQDIILPNMTGLCFWKGRLKFSGSDPAPFPSLIAYFGNKPSRFRKIFKAHGWIILAKKEHS